MYPQPNQQGYAPAQAPPAPVERTLQGTLASVEQRTNGWMRFSLMEPGKQYPVKVDTKQPEIIQQAMALIGQPVGAAVKEQPSTNVNPQSGRPYMNRYLNSIAPLGQLPPPQGGMTYQQLPQQQQSFQSGQPQPAAPQQFGVEQDERQMMIMRQAAAKVVAASWQLLPQEQQNPGGLVEACEVWMSYFAHGPLRFGVQPFGRPSQNGQPGGGSEYNPAYANQGLQHAPPQQAPNVDIFGAPLPDGDSGPPDGYYESLGQ